jgi:hypothetical protein
VVAFLDPDPRRSVAPARVREAQGLVDGGGVHGQRGDHRERRGFPGRGGVRPPGAGGLWWALAELFALTGLAVAQPLLDVTGKAPDFFLLHRSDRAQILLLVAVIVLAPAAGLWLKVFETVTQLCPPERCGQTGTRSGFTTVARQTAKLYRTITSPLDSEVDPATVGEDPTLSQAAPTAPAPRPTSATSSSTRSTGWTASSTPSTPATPSPPCTSCTSCSPTSRSSTSPTAGSTTPGRWAGCRGCGRRGCSCSTSSGT